MAHNRKRKSNYGEAHALMALMVATSQRPGEGNSEFVDKLGAYLADSSFHLTTVTDPDLPDRALLMVDVGDHEGEQALVAISHSDVVGVGSQQWDSDPWELHERDATWFGRGVCDTHGSGVAMLLAAARPGVYEALRAASKRVSIAFTYDEESTSPELSMRGARLLTGNLGSGPLVTTKYFVAGEPTEFGGRIVPMHGHKGRWLAHFVVTVDHAGHVADVVQNAFMLGAEIVQQIGGYARTLRYGSRSDVAHGMYHPPHSTIQVSAVDVKQGDYSTTPARARFTVDMRTLPDTHAALVGEVTDLIATALEEPGVTVALDVLKDAEGSVTEPGSPIVAAAERATGCKAQGFNGGDEGRILRLAAQMEGITLGPGDLRVAHTANEHVKIDSVLTAAEIYAELFRTSVNLG